jgi:hypothetical protein
MLNLILELFWHKPKSCINYKHWIHHCNKTMKQFYINTNRTCVLNLMGGGGNQWEGFLSFIPLPWNHLYSPLF